MKLNALAKQIHSDNVKKGFWPEEDRNLGEILALVHSEVSEALEADRKGHWANLDIEAKTAIDIAPETTFKSSFGKQVKSSFQDEIADTIIRLLDLCAAHDIDIDWHIQAKLRYNRLRAPKHGKRY